MTWCNRHEIHSIDEECWRCNHDREQPSIDAFIAGWNSRQKYKDIIEAHKDLKDDRTRDIIAMAYKDWKNKIKFKKALKGK